ncbi:MAG TPA: bifunctional glutamate N-acetyltransferase/amino-acid acetyltransferase ArgJ [Candidatus Acidoferrales bacterium]|nr:bifunctional glutamate N-acetyltransferase/amino-acid acetyltransferase ArgJ [Candidatus Acidoferrales bacterium]
MKVDVRPIPIRIPGFRFAGVKAGIKESRKRDVAVICSDVPARAAAAFTTNRVKAAPVLVGLRRAGGGKLQAIVVNSGNANAYTGRTGVAMAQRMCRIVAAELGINQELVIPSSTGRIGVQLPWRKIEAGIRAAARSVSPNSFHEALEGIMTTDAFPKFAVEGVVLDGREITIAGMTKGAGMIAPNMQVAPHATNLTYVMTDAAVSAAALRRALRIALPQSFNAVVVDGDTSTNDTAVLLANGVAGNSLVTPSSADFPRLCGALTRVLYTLARMVVKDGEGATKVVDIHVRGARHRRDAERLADTVARSPLCKAAFYGADPYTGRIVCAAGYSGAVFDPQKLDVWFDDVQVVRRGEEIVERVEKRAAAVTRKPEFALTIHLHAGTATAFRMASDLSVEYVRFNSDYRT